MSNYVDEDEDSEDGTEESGNAMKVLRKRDREREKELKELKDLVAKYEAKERKSTIADVLGEKGASPKLARFVERDVEGEVTPEAVHAWLAENGELFGYTDPAQDAEDPTIQQAQRVSQTTAQARPPATLPGDPALQGWSVEKLEAARGDRDKEAQVLKELGFRL